MRLAFLTLLIALSFEAVAQNWKTVPQNDSFYFSGDNHNLKVIWIDSASANAADSMFYFYKSIRADSPTGCIDSMADTWLGASFLRSNDGAERYFNSFHDTILLHTNAGVGTSWLMAKGHGNNLEYHATVTQNGTQTIDGSVDSVKTISIQALQNGIPVNDWYNNKQLALSKHHGWLKALDLYRFPNSINVPYFFGASIDSQEHIRIDNTIKQINIADTQPHARYAPGNEWIRKREWGWFLTWGQLPATLFQHDSVISAQPIPGGLLVTLKTRKIDFSSTSVPDTTYIHTDTIPDASVTLFRDTILPEFNWNLRDIHMNYYSTTNDVYYMRSFSVDTQCTTLLQISSDRLMQGSMGIIRDTQNCIRNPGWGLVYPADTRWSYLQGFGFNYEYYHWIGGSGETSGDETTYPYIKLGNCIIGSKSALAVNDEKKIKDIVKLFPVPAKDNIHIRFPNHHRYTFAVGLA